MNQKRRARLGRSVLGAIGLLAFLALWEIVPLAGWAPPSLLPPPSDIPAAFWHELSSGIWLTSVGLSLTHYVLGLACGTALGMIVGIATGMYPVIDDLLAWVLRLLRPIPGLAWVPFAIIWFGIDQSAAVFIISIGVFWLMYFASHSAIRNVDRDLIEVAESFGFTSGFERLVKVLLPGSMPGILVGFRTALGAAWMAVVAAELFGVTGLGSRMMQASGLLATDIVIVYMLTMAALYGLMDAGFVFAQSRLMQWKP